MLQHHLHAACLSGERTPPLRGDFEAQRHWLSLTSSALLPGFPSLFAGNNNRTAVSVSRWYSHDTAYWGLDYPPLTAYHSLVLGSLARLAPRSAEYVTLRPSGDVEAVQAWESAMLAMELEGGMKSWMRASVVVGDALVWISAVFVYCTRNFAKGKQDQKERAVVRLCPLCPLGMTTNARHWRSQTVAMFSILLQPALILVDSGHFQ